MKNNVGGLVRPSSRVTVKEEKRPVFMVGLMTILLIMTYMFTFKTYEPAHNILVTGGILIYPFTFLIIAYISKYYGYKEAKKSIFISAVLYILFLLIVSLAIIPEPNSATTGYNAVIQYLFANDVTTIGDFRFFYPLLGQFLGILFAFVSSHLLYALIYKAINNYTIDTVAMALSVFIAAIVDRIIFMPILFLENLINKLNTFEYFIKCLTSEFIATIVTTAVIIVIYSFTTMIKNRSKKTKKVSD